MRKKQTRKKTFKKKLNRFRLKTFLLLLLLLLSSLGIYNCGRGRVVKIADGDTITIFTQEGKLEKVRLYGIDCPEINQPGGKEAEEFTHSLAFMEEVSITPLERDRYGRLVAVVHLKDGRSLNEMLVKSGNAWVYRAYCNEPWCVSWLMLEKQAKTSRRGLWAQKNPTAPWNWRKKKPAS